MSPSRRNFTPRICHGTIDTGDKTIPMEATLLEGEQRMVAPTFYRDIVTVTLTPLHWACGFQAQYYPP